MLTMFQNEESEDLVTTIFTNAQYQQILNLLNKQDNKGINVIANTTQVMGNSYSFMTLGSDSWIIDSGASDHMCHDLN